MMGSVAWALVGDAPTRNRTDVDQYARQEYGGPDSAWLIRADDLHTPPQEPVNQVEVDPGLFRRIAQAFGVFL